MLSILVFVCFSASSEDIPSSGFLIKIKRLYNPIVDLFAHLARKIKNCLSLFLYILKRVKVFVIDIFVLLTDAVLFLVHKITNLLRFPYNIWLLLFKTEKYDMISFSERFMIKYTISDFEDSEGHYVIQFPIPVNRAYIVVPPLDLDALSFKYEIETEDGILSRTKVTSVGDVKNRYFIHNEREWRVLHIYICQPGLIEYATKIQVVSQIIDNK